MRQKRAFVKALHSFCLAFWLLFIAACSEDRTLEPTGEKELSDANNGKEAEDEADNDATEEGKDAVNSGDEGGGETDTGEEPFIPPEEEADGGEPLDAGKEDAEFEDGGEEPDGSEDVGESDSGEELDADEPDQDSGKEDVECPEEVDFDYSCNAADPDSCPGGMCVLGNCIGPVLDPDRWADCGDTVCDLCERGCPADCGPPHIVSGEKNYGGEDTITVWVHGFYNKSADKVAKMVYGVAEGCGGILDGLKTYGIDRPCANTAEGLQDPNHLAKIEYYGALPPDWMSEADIQEIESYPYEGPSALERYARIIGKAIRRHLEVSGAKYVNMACHSMGCYITRFLIENDIENLASEGKIVKWFTSTGVIAGARLARLYDNPTVRQGAELIGLELSDFVIMNPDFTMDKVAVWDHKIYEANNPYFSGILIHHLAATKPEVAEAMNLKLLDLNNPGDEPNDGIVYTFDEFFHEQEAAASFIAKSGAPSKPTRCYIYTDHMSAPKSETATLLAAASLFNKRKVAITLTEIRLDNARESKNLLDGEYGELPAEVIVETEARYNPYVLQTFGKNVLVHEDKLDYRSPEMIIVEEKSTQIHDLRIFEGPIFDGMEELNLKISVLEVDYYPRMGVEEWMFDKHQGLMSFNGQVALKDHSFKVDSKYGYVIIEVKITELY